MCLFGASVLGANGQVLPAAAAISGHDATVNSSEAYLQLEGSINQLAVQLRDAYGEHPNLQYRPSYGDNGEIVGYLITGAGSAKNANEISQILMELDALGEIAASVDPQYLPTAKSERIAKREAKD